MEISKKQIKKLCELINSVWDNFDKELHYAESHTCFNFEYITENQTNYLNFCPIQKRKDNEISSGLFGVDIFKLINKFNKLKIKVIKQVFVTTNDNTKLCFKLKYKSTKIVLKIYSRAFKNQDFVYDIDKEEFDNNSKAE
jgi:hypothetical protein